MSGNTLWTRCIRALFVLGALGVATSHAQQGLPVPPMDADADLPPELSFVTPDSATPESVEPGELVGPLTSPFDDCHCNDDQYNWWGVMPAVTESSGTWLRRGFWYSEVDAVVLNRFWSRTDALFAFDGTFVNPNDPIPITLETNRFLILKGAHPGHDAGVRFMLGRFLFRDEENRDHTAEFTAFSGGDWSLVCGVESVAPNALQVPFVRSGNNASFDGSSSMDLSYTSRFNSFEANYRVKRRMDKDQMILQPTGQWVRRANRTLTREFLIGLRYFELSERLYWTAEDIIDNLYGINNEDGEYLIETNNDLFGFQLGGGHTYETARWSVNALGKAGVYLNDASGDSFYRVTSNNSDNSNLAFNNHGAEKQLSFIGDFRLTGRWYLTPNCSLRAGYELLYVTSTALATHQAHFIPDYSKLSTSGDPFFHGASFGIEGYW